VRVMHVIEAMHRGGAESQVVEYARAAAFGRAGQRRWREHSTAENMVRETETLYRAVLRRGAESNPTERPVRRGTAA